MAPTSSGVVLCFCTTSAVSRTNRSNRITQLLACLQQYLLSIFPQHLPDELSDGSSVNFLKLLVLVQQTSVRIGHETNLRKIYASQLLSSLLPLVQIKAFVKGLIGISSDDTPQSSASPLLLLLLPPPPYRHHQCHFAP